jgi:hypothetical protein
MFMSELFPAPEGPSIAESWPDLKNPLKPWRIVLPPAKSGCLIDTISLITEENNKIYS